MTEHDETGFRPKEKSKKKHKIYVFPFGKWHDDVRGLAIGDDGKILAGHVSSVKEFIKHDLGVTSDWHHTTYRNAYGEGNYEVVYTEDPPKEILKFAEESGEKKQ